MSIQLSMCWREKVFKQISWNKNAKVTVDCVTENQFTLVD